MKKIFAMMTVLVLFVLACSNAIKPGAQENGSFLPDGTSDAVGDALVDSKDQISSTEGMITYYASVSEKQDEGGTVTGVVNIFLNADKTQMKQTSAAEYNGKCIPFGTEVFDFDKAVLQMAEEGTLTEIKGKKLYTRTAEGKKDKEVDYIKSGYTIYEFKQTSGKYKESSEKPFTGTGNWETTESANLSTSAYLIKEDGNKLYLIYINKESDGTYTISDSKNLAKPNEYDTYTKG